MSMLTAVSVTQSLQLTDAMRKIKVTHVRRKWPHWCRNEGISGELFELETHNIALIDYYVLGSMIFVDLLKFRVYHG